MLKNDIEELNKHNNNKAILYFIKCIKLISYFKFCNIYNCILRTLSLLYKFYSS